MKRIVTTLLLSTFCMGAAMSVAEAKRLDCNAVRGMKSTNGGKDVTIKIINKTGEQRTAMWVDYNGTLIEYFTLQPGESHNQQTFTTHPWVFTDGPGNCIEAMLPSATKFTYKIKVPSPGFGAE